MDFLVVFCCVLRTLAHRIWLLKREGRTDGHPQEPGMEKKRGVARGNTIHLLCFFCPPYPIFYAKLQAILLIVLDAFAALLLNVLPRRVPSLDLSGLLASSSASATAGNSLP